MKEVPFKVWIMGARPRTLTASVCPVAVGTSVALKPDFLRALLALLVAVSLQLAVNFANDYFDGTSGVDTPDRKGPTRITAAGLAPASAVRSAAMYCAIAGCVFGAVLALLSDPRLIAFGVFAVAAAFAYSGGPKPYASLGVGELFVFVFFGLFATMGTAHAQGRRISDLAVAVAVAQGLLAVLIMLANNIRDVPTDLAAGKKTLPARLGDRASRRLFAVLFVGGTSLMPWYLTLRNNRWAVFGLIASVVALRFLKQFAATASDKLGPFIGKLALVQVLATAAFLADRATL